VYTVATIPYLTPSYATVSFGLWPLLVPAACFAVMLLAPRRRAPDVRRLAWLAATATIAYSARGDGDPTAPIVILALIGLFLPAVARLGTDPRLAIACALLTTDVGVIVAARQPADPEAAPLLWFLIAAPLVLAFVVARTRRLQRGRYS
jgi:hypothetical protein